MDAAAHYLADARQRFEELKRLAEAALIQSSDAQFFASLADPGVDNSLAIIVKHLAGNLRSRWTDFLTSDGEKPDRRRDSEFLIESAETRPALMERWERGWSALFDALAALRGEDLMRQVRIRGETHTVIQAIDRQLSHYAYHVGQIVQLARWHAGAGWQTLSVPRGGSVAFNAEMKRRFPGDENAGSDAEGPGDQGAASPE